MFIYPHVCETGFFLAKGGTKVEDFKVAMILSGTLSVNIPLMRGGWEKKQNLTIGAQSPGEGGGGAGCDGQLEGGKERRGMEGWREAYSGRNFPCWPPSVAT